MIYISKKLNGNKQGQVSINIGNNFIKPQQISKPQNISMNCYTFRIDFSDNFNIFEYILCK